MSKDVFSLNLKGRPINLDFTKLVGDEVIVHLREKSGYSFLKRFMVDVRNQVNRNVYFCMSYRMPLVKGRHIVHLRDFRDMAISQYWTTFTHPKGEGETGIKKQLRLLGNNPKNPKMSVDEFIKREDEWNTRSDRLVHTDGYTTRFFRECIVPEYDSMLGFNNVSHHTMKVVYYEDMVTDFRLYLNEMNSFLDNVLDVELLYNKYSHEFQPETGPWTDPNIPMNTFKGHKRRVFPGGYKEEMSTELGNYFNSEYKNYPFLKRYIDE